MGKRGPQPGFKKARAAQAAAPSSASAVIKPAAPAKKVAAKTVAPAAEPIVLNAADRENPNKLTGQALRDLAHRRGMAKSILADMPDEKIRMELRYITGRQYEDAVA